MRSIYLIEAGSERCIANLTEEEVKSNKKKGWKFYLLGLSSPKTMPGVLAEVTNLGHFEANKEQCRV